MGGPVLLIILDHVICLTSGEPPDIVYHNSYILIGDLPLFRVSYSHRILKPEDVTFVSIFSAGNGSRNKMMIQKKQFYKTIG